MKMRNKILFCFSKLVLDFNYQNEVNSNNKSRHWILLVFKSSCENVMKSQAKLF